jgi:pimeloyl-ACP methyl ester carboxylesterase
MLRHSAPALLLLTLVACAGADPTDTVRAGETRSADGVAIRYDVRGAGDPALVLVHGWTNTRGIWGEHPTTLARTHRVVTLDLAGHGESGAEREEWTMDAFGEDVVAVVEALELERVVLVGFSMGAAAVLEAAERMPDRVEGVVFVDALHDPEQSHTPAEVEGMISAFRAAWGDTAFVRAFAFRPDTPDSLVRYVSSMMPADPREHWFPTARAMNAWAARELRPTLQRVTAPIAAINTTNAPTNVEALRRYASSFTVDTLEGLGHAGILLQRVEDFDARLLAIVRGFN